MKNCFLDRVGGVLARAKGAVGEVASAYMVEVEDEKSNKRVKILVAKNEGFSGSNVDYLCELDVAWSGLHGVVSLSLLRCNAANDRSAGGQR